MALGTLLTLLTLLAGSPAAGQTRSVAGSDSGGSAVRGWSLGGWVAGATGQPLETRLGHVHDRALFITALRALHPLVITPRFRLQSTVDLFPLVVATANRGYAIEQFSECGGVALCEVVGDSLVPSLHTAYAAGIAPLGFEGIVALWRRVGLSLGVEGGALYFNQRIPDPGETRFNFMADANAALRISLGTSHPALVAGFRLNHISNGGTGRVNPGMDSRMLFVGVER